MEVGFFSNHKLKVVFSLFFTKGPWSGLNRLRDNDLMFNAPLWELFLMFSVPERDSISLLPLRNVTEECNESTLHCFHLQHIIVLVVIVAKWLQTNVSYLLSPLLLFLAGSDKKFSTLWLHLKCLSWFEFFPDLPNSLCCSPCSSFYWQLCSLHSLWRPSCQSTIRDNGGAGQSLTRILSSLRLCL